MKFYHWLGSDADNDPDVINALESPAPLVVIDTTDIDE